jgi:YHS domain-containing protein
MTFLARILRYLFWLLVISWSAAILRRIVGQMVIGGNQTKQDVDVPNDAVNHKLVRDPVCGLHVAEGLALPLMQGSEVVHFCSAECREKYLSKSQKFSASA